MGTKLQELRNGCFAKAMDDEPMMVLLARDVSAADFTDAWADRREEDISAGRKPASDMAQVQEARQNAADMRAWREANDGKWRTGLFARQEQLTDAVSAGMAAEQAKIPAAMGETRDDMLRRDAAKPWDGGAGEPGQPGDPEPR